MTGDEMIRDPKVGEKLAFYSGHKRLVLNLSDIDPNGLLYFAEKDNPGHMNYVAHPKQCRRLVKKPRRRVWLNTLQIDRILPNAEFQSLSVWIGEKPSNLDYREFVEVEKKK